jgi:hypothetical protein
MQPHCRGLFVLGETKSKLVMKKNVNKRILQIELFFEYVNWYKLLQSWKLFPTFVEAVDTVNLLRENKKLIRRTWLDNIELTLPQVLAMLILLPLDNVKKGYNNTTWYFSTIDQLMETMKIPTSKYVIWYSPFDVLNIRRKQPMYYVIAKMPTWRIKRALSLRQVTTTKFKEAFDAELKSRSV